MKKLIRKVKFAVAHSRNKRLYNAILAGKEIDMYHAKIY